MASSRLIVNFAIIALIAITLPQGILSRGYGKCQCASVCPFLLDPVCVTLRNGTQKEYPNSCELDKAICTEYLDEASRANGACVKPGCPTFCTADYRPICGTLADGTEKTFSNACDLGSQVCQNDLVVVSQRDGECVKPGCPAFCTAEYRPICATLADGTEKTFSNACVLGSKVCQNDLVVVSQRDGACAKPGCPTFCTTDYRPICGTLADGTEITFSNACDLGSKVCQNYLVVVSQRDGACVKPGCLNFCTDDYRPICVTLADGTEKIFSNACNLDAAVCFNDLVVVSQRDGECSTVS